MIPLAAFAFIPPLLLLAALLALASPNAPEDSLRRILPPAIITIALVAWLPLAATINQTGLVLGLAGWVLAAAPFVLWNSQAQRPVWLVLLPPAVLLLAASARVPEIPNLRLGASIPPILAFNMTYLSLAAAFINSATITNLSRPGFGEHLPQIPELWLLRRTRSAGLVLALAFLTISAAYLALNRPPGLWKVAAPWAIAAILQSRLLPLSHKAQAYGGILACVAALLFAADTLLGGS